MLIMASPLEPSIGAKIPIEYKKHLHMGILASIDPSIVVKPMMIPMMNR